MSRPLVTVGSCDVYPEDLYAIRPGNWFTDTSIHLAFELLKAQGALVHLISPQAAFVLLHEEDEDDFVDSITGALTLSSSGHDPRPCVCSQTCPCTCPAESASAAESFYSRVTVFPINNSAPHLSHTNSTGSGGGTHWTALIHVPDFPSAHPHTGQGDVSGEGGVFWYLDSRPGSPCDPLRVPTSPGAAKPYAHDAPARGESGQRTVAAAAGLSCDGPHCSRDSMWPAITRLAARLRAVLPPPPHTGKGAAHVDVEVLCGLVRQGNTSDCGPMVVGWARALARESTFPSPRESGSAALEEEGASHCPTDECQCACKRRHSPLMTPQKTAEVIAAFGAGNGASARKGAEVAGAIQAAAEVRSWLATEIAARAQQS